MCSSVKHKRWHSLTWPPGTLAPVPARLSDVVPAWACHIRQLTLETVSGRPRHLLRHLYSLAAFTAFLLITGFKQLDYDVLWCGVFPSCFLCLAFIQFGFVYLQFYQIWKISTTVSLSIFLHGPPFRDSKLCTLTTVVVPYFPNALFTFWTFLFLFFSDSFYCYGFTSTNLFFCSSVSDVDSVET